MPTRGSFSYHPPLEPLVKGGGGRWRPRTGACVLEGLAMLRSESDLMVVVEISAPPLSFPHRCLHLGACRCHAAISDQRPRPPLPRAAHSQIRRNPRDLLSPSRGLTARVSFSFDRGVFYS
uniref:Uncharacterized protein n=1 Tax=Arundo donax TaxID=35708 RepID=A0A0A8YQD2_ARUDO